VTTGASNHWIWTY